MIFHLSVFQLAVNLVVAFVVGSIISYVNTRRMLANHTKRVRDEQDAAMRGAIEKLEAERLMAGTEPFVRKEGR